MIASDGFEIGATPPCPYCGTVLRREAHGYWCASCRLILVGV